MFEPPFSFSSEIEENPKKQPTNFFLAKLSGRSTSLLVLKENEVLADGDCGFTALGVSRKTLTQELRTAGRSLRHRQFLSEEIASAFMLKELKPPDVLWQPLEEAYQANPTEETRKALYDYCYQPSVFNYYVDALSQHLWLGYKSALLYAESANITLYIWRKDEKQQDHLVLLEKREAEDSPSNVIHMLHTHGFTHFNLLSESELRAWESRYPSDDPSTTEDNHFDKRTMGNRLSVHSALQYYLDSSEEEQVVAPKKENNLDPTELVIAALKEGGVPFYSPPLLKEESSRYFALVKLLVRDESLKEKEILAAKKANTAYEKLYPYKRDWYRFMYAKQTLLAVAGYIRKNQSSLVTLHDYADSVLKQLAEEKKGIEEEFEKRLVERMKPLYEQWGWNFDVFLQKEKEWLLSSSQHLWPTESELSSNPYYVLADVAALDNLVNQLEEQAKQFEISENKLYEKCEQEENKIHEIPELVEYEEIKETLITLVKTIFEKDTDGTPKGLPRSYRNRITKEDLKKIPHQVDSNTIEKSSGSNLALLAIKYRNNDIYIFLRDHLKANIDEPNEFGLTAHDYELIDQENPTFKSDVVKDIVQKTSNKHYSRHHSELLLIKAKTALIWYYEEWCKENAEKEAIYNSPDQGFSRFLLKLSDILFKTEMIFAGREGEVQNLLGKVNKALEAVPVEGFLSEIRKQSNSIHSGYFEGRLEKIAHRLIEIIEGNRQRYEYLIFPKTAIKAALEEREEQKKKNQELEKKIQDQKEEWERERKKEKQVQEKQREKEKREREDEKQELKKEFETRNEALEKKTQNLEQQLKKEKQERVEEKQELKEEFEARNEILEKQTQERERQWGNRTQELENKIQKQQQRSEIEKQELKTEFGNKTQELENKNQALQNKVQAQEEEQKKEKEATQRKLEDMEAKMKAMFEALSARQEKIEEKGGNDKDAVKGSEPRSSPTFF
jgi:hypothetical protein